MILPAYGSFYITIPVTFSSAASVTASLVSLSECLLGMRIKRRHIVLAYSSSGHEESLGHGREGAKTSKKVKIAGDTM